MYIVSLRWDRKPCSFTAFYQAFTVSVKVYKRAETSSREIVQLYMYLFHFSQCPTNKHFSLSNDPLNAFHRSSLNNSCSLHAFLLCSFSKMQRSLPTASWRCQKLVKRSAEPGAWEDCLGFKVRMINCLWLLLNYKINCICTVSHS